MENVKAVQPNAHVFNAHAFNGCTGKFFGKTLEHDLNR